LIQVDNDGSTTIYNIINVNCENSNSSYFSIYPNPSNGNLNLILNDQRFSGDALVRILDTKGNLILNKPIDVKDGINIYIVDEEISSGIYYINNGNHSTAIVKHIVL